MKKTLAFIVLFFIALGVNAQQKNSFKIKYLPEHSYKNNSKTEMNMSMDISGDSVKMKQLQTQGIKLPMIMTSTTQMNLDVKSGAVKPNGSFPIIFKYTDINGVQNLNGKENSVAANPLVGQSVFAESTNDGKIEVDSISGKTMDEQLKSMVSSMIDNLSKQVQFPEKPLNIGETFEQDVPFSMPIAGLNIQFVVKIVYKLINVENGSAYFDLDESLTLNMSGQKDEVSMSASGTGNGEGKLVYSIPKNFPTSLTTYLDFKLKMLVQNMTMNITAKISSLTQTEINSLNK